MDMKKVLGLVLALALLVNIAPAFAQARFGTRTSRPIETSGIMIDQSGNTMDYSVWLYGVTVYADAASSYVGLYDCDTVTELLHSTIYPRYEIGEPTQYETTTVQFDTPKYFSDGVGAIISTGVAFVEYGPEPV